MQKSHENVILFPKWKTSLEDKSLQAMKEKNYEEALTSLNKLLSYHINSHEIIIGKLICLMELGRYEEAQDLCEQVLKQRDENYYHYLHIYLTILFQTSQYELLMEQVEDAFANKVIPSTVEEQFQQLYDMSEQMKNDIKSERHTEYINELEQAIRDENHSLQWRLIESLRKMKIQPAETTIALLADDNIHPVTKTAIFHWLQDKEVDRDITVHKLNLRSTVNPIHVPSLSTDVTMKQTLLLISELEQNNPSLFHLLKQLLFRYTYVRYPIMFPREDIMQVAEALKCIGNDYMNIYNRQTNDIQNDSTIDYIEEIKMCEVLYLSIIEE